MINNAQQIKCGKSVVNGAFASPVWMRSFEAFSNEKRLINSRQRKTETAFMPCKRVNSKDFHLTISQLIVFINYLEVVSRRCGRFFVVIIEHFCPVMFKESVVKLWYFLKPQILPKSLKFSDSTNIIALSNKNIQSDESIEIIRAVGTGSLIQRGGKSEQKIYRL